MNAGVASKRESSAVHRVILFDIDETVLSTGGAGGRAMEKAISSVFGRTITSKGYSFSGKTDPQIIFELLEVHGIARQQAERSLDEIFTVYLPILVDEVERSQSRLHDGVVDLLETLRTRDDACIGLLTGNIEEGARVKLGKFDLNSYFKFGAFGSDSHDRMKLPAVAHKRAEAVFGRAFSASQLVIIGDARNDVLCAKGYGARAMAVCTGKTPRATLAELEPDHLFDSLQDTAMVMDAIFAN